ncbi:MAG: hypothetical protein ACLPVW_19455, partial [Terriglobales bacterium]
MIQSVLPQLTFSFNRHQPIHADFSGGQISSDAGLLPLRAFDEQNLTALAHLVAAEMDELLDQSVIEVHQVAGARRVL